MAELGLGRVGAFNGVGDLVLPGIRDEIWLELEIWLNSRFCFIADSLGLEICLGRRFGCVGFLVEFHIWMNFSFG